MASNQGLANRLALAQRNLPIRETQGRGVVDTTSRPVIFDSHGREIEVSAFDNAGSQGLVVSRANSGFLVGGTGYATHGASFRKRALASWIPYTGSADTDIVRNLPILRGRSRDLYMSFPIARSAIDTKVKNVVGTGIRPMPLPDGDVLELSDDDTIELGKLILREWRAHMETELCDWDRQSNVYEKQAEIYLVKEHSGDAPLLFTWRQDGRFPYEFKLRTVDPDRVCNPYTIPVPTDQHNVWGGIEYDHFNGPLTHYWVAEFHPMDFALSPQLVQQKWQRIKVFTDQYMTRNACIHMNKERANQRRGVPPLAVCLEMGKGMMRFNHEKIQKEVINNMFSVFIKSPMPTDETFRAYGFSHEQIRDFYKIFPYDVTMEPGGVTFMKSGDEIEFAKPELGATDYKVYNEMNGIIFCSSIGVPYEIAMKHFGASYSASKGAFGEFYNTVKCDRQTLVNQVCTHIYDNFIGELIQKRVIKFKKFFTDWRIRRALTRVLWTGMAQISIEPLKEIQAAMMKVQLGVSTVQRESHEWNDTNWEENVIQLAKEKKFFENLGLTYLMFAGTPNISMMKVGNEQKEAQSESGQTNDGSQQSGNNQNAHAENVHAD